jgi:CRP-like cAMP-binding protein
MQKKIEFVDLELLSRCGLLNGLAREALAGILNSGSRKRAEAKEVVFNRGDTGSDIYFLLSGGVKISTLSREGKEIIFDVLVEGDFFGDMSLFDDKPRTGTVTALVPSAFLVLGKARFLELLEKYPGVSIRLIKTLTARLRLMDTFLEDVLFLDAEARLAKRVMALSRIFGQEGKNGEVRIDLKMSQQEMANLVGIARESVNKHFKGWEKSGVIGLDKGCLILQQPELLESMVAQL